MNEYRAGMQAVSTAAVVLIAVFAIVAVFLVNSPPGPVAASSGGKVGLSGNPASGGQTCARCHRGGTAPEVQISGPSAVEAGSTSMFTLTISGGQEAGGGLNVSAPDGMLRVPLGNDDVQLMSDEITHLRPKQAGNAGDIAFNFLWSAPSADGEYALYGAGNSVDLDGGTSGDGVATDMLAVLVRGGAAPSTTPSITATVTVSPTIETPTSPPPMTATPTDEPTPVPTSPGPDNLHIYLPLVQVSWAFE